MAVEKPTAAISKPEKKKFRGLPTASEKKTRNGATKRAIWVLEPTAISMATSIWSRMASRMAPACSAALPTTGTRIRPTNGFDRPRALTAGWRAFAAVAARARQLTPSGRPPQDQERRDADSGGVGDGAIEAATLPGAQLHRQVPGRLAAQRRQRPEAHGAGDEHEPLDARGLGD